MFARSLLRTAKIGQFAPFANGIKSSVYTTSRGLATGQAPDLTPLKFEQNIYATIDIHNRPYLVTLGDEITLPFRMKHAEIGDTLRFTDIKTLGSKNYTYNISEGIDPSVATIKGVILEKTKNPMTVKEITKRRNRHTRHVQVKHDLTKVRITELSLKL